MDKYKWRKKAKFVGYVDLVFSVIALLLLTFNAIAISATTLSTELSLATANIGGASDQRAVVDSHPHLGKDHAKEMWAMYYAKAGSTVVLVMSIATAVGALITIVQTLAAINLLKATKKTREPKEALKLAIFWRNANVAFMGLYVICFVGVITEWLPVKLYGTIFIGFVLHVVFIYIVLQYIKELQEATESEILVNAEGEPGEDIESKTRLRTVDL